MNIIIVGCGRVGSQLAMLFSERKDDVVIIDAEAEALAKISRNFEGRTIIGVGFDEDVLLDAGIEECDVLVAATNIDNTNLMISEVGRNLFNVPHVLARLYNPTRQSVYLQLGLDYVCGTEVIAEEMYSKILAGHGKHIDTFGDYEIMHFLLDLSADGKDAIRVSELEREHEIRVIAFERKEGGQSSIPASDSILYPGDLVLACIRTDLLDEFARYMK